MTKGYLALILHAHLPYVRNIYKTDDRAELWLYEAITETYIPLLNVLTRLQKKDLEFNLTISFSPPLTSMLNDKLLQARYKKHLIKLIKLAEKEIDRTKSDQQFNRLARFYHKLFTMTYHTFADQYGGNILEGYRKIEESGKLELITTAATHGYLPLMLTPEAAGAQLAVGLKSHQTIFHKKPAGFWLPECGFKAELAPLIAEQKIKYFFASSHAINFAVPRPRYGVYAPLFTPQGTAVFGREPFSSEQVWSAEQGYPGDKNYREFYRDIGFDLDLSYLQPYLSSDQRRQLGIKYYRITGKHAARKEVYHPESARRIAAEHAVHFLSSLKKRFNYLNSTMERTPLITAPYDAELFGHWWYEGPIWLEKLLELIGRDDEVKTISPTHYLELYPVNQTAMPAESSWGARGYHEVWLNDRNDWVYRYLHTAETTLITLVEKNLKLKYKKGLVYRGLNQLAKELLLAQSSDWAFIIKTETMVDYALLRTRAHLANFFILADQIKKRTIKQSFIEKLENENNLFPFLDFKVYQQKYSQQMRKEG